jgi:hypothetical protein
MLKVPNIEIRSRREFSGHTFLRLLIMWFLVSIPLYSQISGSGLTGTVTDESGAAIPRAAVSIMNVAMAVRVNVHTNAQGIFNAPNLLPGNYRVTVSATGFEVVVQSGVTLTVGTQQVLIHYPVGTFKSQELADNALSGAFVICWLG